MASEQLRDQLSTAYRRLLHPLIRILIRNGVTAMETCEIVRKVFVDAATDREFELSGRRQSDSRIAILTGLSRKEVSRLRHNNSNPKGANLSRVARVVAGWNQDPDFTGPYGLPLTVPFEADTSLSTPSFVELVRRHSGDMPPRAVLDELVRTGLAVVDENDLIRNTGRINTATKLDPEAIERLGRVIARIADTVDLNNQVADSENGRYERHVETDVRLTQEQYERFSIFLRQQCEQLLETLDNWLVERERRTPGHSQEPSPKKRLTTDVGIYYSLDERMPFDDDNSAAGDNK